MRQGRGGVMLLHPSPRASGLCMSKTATTNLKSAGDRADRLLGMGFHVTHDRFGDGVSAVSFPNLSRAVGVLVHAVLRLCAPRKVAWNIVGRVPVEVAADIARRPRPVESLADDRRTRTPSELAVVARQVHVDVPKPALVPAQHARHNAAQGDDVSVFTKQVAGKAGNGSCFHVWTICCVITQSVVHNSQGCR